MTLPRTPSLRLDGKRALVTGASSGIGQACAVALAEAGAHVICTARGADRLNETVAEMQAEGWSAAALPLDIADLDVMRDALSGQRLDVMVNSAGLARHGPAMETTPEDYDAVMGVNLRAAYFLSVAAAKAMPETGGSIIHISSQMGHVGGIDRAVYCASKHGLEGMIKAMAIEWGKRRIRINSICPTFIRTPLTAQTFDNPERAAWIEEKIKLGRVGEVEDIMGAVLYLASDASALVTGTSMLIDGGWTAD
ncbi:2-deoxy-D-gluconate 3-dehydrogenase [Mameliella alba]|uniref:SDR family NAD(P)-dependent oxidoreductase n=1 Tax=Mameliella alba TaxID=561184 RepID=UPI0008814FAB|nr:SDR family oxidoreductase [Mameliella alba]OWV48180.1 3-oxoacyl-ACP reductase [Mameliella alba]PTR40214.1 2-deoxy-D-gluconate 3-dehydrogenase [Mameliella alba]GGF43193.1 3-oxoacyl-ACP reductase [Mameliella alba]SDC95987.1 2-deoxy-D-gluconate 3-dehydrogenase [Mameliella alba]